MLEGVGAHHEVPSQGGHQARAEVGFDLGRVDSEKVEEVILVLDHVSVSCTCYLLIVSE